ncbi:MAG TPA: NACHT domain-containing protein [Pyrinomonadaceae bacterium]|nr:NACHT domain-containing protein [Pyrinomonadaceae bacterium]
MKHVPANVRYSLSLIVFPVLGNIVASLLQEWIGADWRTRAALIILFTLIGVAVVYFERRKESGGAEDRRQAALALQNRREMLQKVRAYWIAGVFQKSLHREILIELDLAEKPGAVIRPLDVLVRRADGTERPLPPGAKITDVFDQSGHALLVLGAPGAGKTTLLLELTRDLLERAAEDDAHPMPVVFPLSSWGESQRPLADWLVDELAKRYDVPRTIGQPWVDNDQVLLLLDGLDEVKDMAGCVAAINDFRQGHGLLPIAVSCRSQEYDELLKQLTLENAVTVQPLTRARIDNYFTQVGGPLAAVREALNDDPSLWELLDTPLMLNIMTLAYVGRPAGPLAAGSNLEERRVQLFSAYVERMFQRGRADAPYTREQTLRWLEWLAWQMRRHGQTVFYMEQMQPDWLVGWQRWALVIGPTLVLYLLVTWFYSIAFGKWAWLMSLFSLPLLFSRNIRTVEKVHWSWSDVRNGLPFVSVMSIVLGLVTILFYEPLIGLAVIGASFVAMSLFGGLTVGNLETKMSSNEGIRRALRNALIFGSSICVLSGLAGGLIVGLGRGVFHGVVIGLGGGVNAGFHASLNFGGLTVLQHFTLRSMLVWNRCAPFDYAGFLDYAVERIFMRKVGGGYIFIHRGLLEYFAARHPAPGVGAAPRSVREGDRQLAEGGGV